ncbi:MAG TPA: hypothetical protein PK580_04100 [Nitrosomonas halophila]|nr:hypothetical protein [Nitrosomonas halophila]
MPTAGKNHSPWLSVMEMASVSSMLMARCKILTPPRNSEILTTDNVYVRIGNRLKSYSNMPARSQPLNSPLIHKLAGRSQDRYAGHEDNDDLEEIKAAMVHR